MLVAATFLGLDMKSAGRLRKRWGLVIMMFVFGRAIMASAHDHQGPPLPLVTEQRVGPYVVSLWAHAIVGTGKLFVSVKLPAGEAVPDDLKVEIGLEPAQGRLGEKRYIAQRDPSTGQAQFQTDASFDTQEIWRVRVRLQSSLGSAETLATVNATPMGPTRWALLLYLLPFAAVGFLWVRMIVKMRSLRHEKLMAQNSLM